jgi:hypothetical protein
MAATFLGRHGTPSRYSEYSVFVTIVNESEQLAAAADAPDT